MANAWKGAIWASLLAFFMSPTHVLSQTATIYGRIIDTNSGGPLFGATVLLNDDGGEQIAGTASLRNGQYTFSGIGPATYSMQVSFVGYETVTSIISVKEGQQLEKNIALSPTGLSLDNVVISSSRRRERLMETPSSVSVLESREIGFRFGTTSADALRTVTGVNIVYTGIESTELSLRGFNRVFSSDVLLLSDDRQTNLPAWGLTLPNISPGRLDIEKIEVVRGPGASLYGGGADVGVIQYVTKNPFEHPGTSFSISGGERNYKGFEVRHAGVLGSDERLGYKVNVQHISADEWRYDPSDSQDAVILDRMIDKNDNRYETERTQIDAEIKYRWSDIRSLSFNAGRTYMTNNRLGGPGRFFLDRFILEYAQLRYRQGGLFAQAYIFQGVNNGNNFFYDVDYDKDGTADPFLDDSFMYAAQLQYEYDFNSSNSVVVGVDSDWQVPRSGGTLFGVFEDKDETREAGIYALSRHTIARGLDLSLGARADHHSVLKEVYLTPRAALVYTPAPGHKFRASIIRGYSPPHPAQLFLDNKLGTLFGPVEIILRSNPTDIQWEQNPNFPLIGGSNYSVTSIIPGMEGTRMPAGLPIDIVYGLIYGGGLASLPPAVLAGAMQQFGITASEQQAADILVQLSPINTSVSGFSQGSFHRLNAATGQFGESIMPVPLEKRIPRFNTSIELGYRGLLTDKLIFEVELYRSRFKNFVGFVSAPFVLVQQLEEDLSAALTNGIGSNSELSSLLSSLGLSSEEFSAFLMGLVGGAPIGPNTPIAILQPVEEGVPGEGEAPVWFIHSDQRGSISIWGIDTSFEYQPMSAWTVIGNMSWIHKNLFGPEDAGVDDSDFRLDTSTPKIITSLGVEYSSNPWAFYVSGRYRGGFKRRRGLVIYSGTVDAFFSLDASTSYDFSAYVSGLKLGINVRNVLNNHHREFVAAPKIGRFGQLRLTYDLK